MNTRPPSAGKTEDPRDTTAFAPAQIAAQLPYLVERMHRRFLDVVRLELERQGIADISPVQAMMLGNIGFDEISVHELIERGYYLGSNASYNLKQLVDGGYIERRTAARDRRAARLTLSEKGKKILEALTRLNAAMAAPLHDNPAALETAFRLLRKLEQRWSDAVHAKGGAGGGE